MATIYDVAKAAGVSPKTVSRVINGEPYVREALRHEVWAAIQRLDYRVNFNARQMRTQRSQAIGFISDEVSTSTFAVDIIRGAFKAAGKHHQILLFVNTEHDAEIEESAINLLLQRQVDGLIYAADYHREVTIPRALYGLPTVLVDCFINDRSLPSVVPDEVKGGYTATKTLLEKGHRRIGFVQNSDAIPASFGRLAGYKQALAEVGIAFDADLVVPNRSEPAGGYEASRQLLALSNRPTALFCFNDRMAVGAYRAAQEARLSIPNDVAVLGFDNQEMIGEILNPPLTTLRLPHYEMGYWAVEHLLQLVRDPDGADRHLPLQLTFDCPLVERESV